MTECVHEMLPGTCSWCLGQPDVPLIDDLFLDESTGHGREPNRNYRGSSNAALKPVDRCTNCGAGITDDDKATWSPTVGGLVGPCCEESS